MYKTEIYDSPLQTCNCDFAFGGSKCKYMYIKLWLAIYISGCLIK